MEKNTIRSLDRGLAILSCFDIHTESLALNQIAERVNLSVATSLRFVNALVEYGFLKKTDGKRYSLGMKAYILGVVAMSHFKIHRVAQPIMTALRDETREAISLYTFEDEERVCCQHVESLLSMRCAVRVGERFPLWAGASGKCLLAYAAPEVVEREMAKLHAMTDSTIVDRDSFLKELQQVRETEQAVSHGEREQGIVSLAVPIFTTRNQVDYVLSVAAPASRATPELVRKYIALSKDAARKIARQIYGW
ncbi:IclR family transcriptional regulator [Oleispirillum naphthae]|uniref:IclR family transcriptional regulator n=1 Tax=Oleispirillum naphthae TaxID=2838853 RepID=UPI0030822D2C